VLGLLFDRRGTWKTLAGDLARAMFLVSPSQKLEALFNHLYNLTDIAEIVRISAEHEVPFPDEGSFDVSFNDLARAICSAAFESGGGHGQAEEYLHHRRRRCGP
jgi:hypothetical protein